MLQYLKFNKENTSSRIFTKLKACLFELSSTDIDVHHYYIHVHGSYSLKCNVQHIQCLNLVILSIKFDE